MYVLKLKMELMPYYCGFNIINALRETEPGELSNLVVEFAPHEE